MGARSLAAIAYLLLGKNNNAEPAKKRQKNNPSLLPSLLYYRSVIICRKLCGVKNNIIRFS
jgi:hypothetical protein